MKIFFENMLENLLYFWYNYFSKELLKANENILEEKVSTTPANENTITTNHVCPPISIRKSTHKRKSMKAVVSNKMIKRPVYIFMWNMY